VASLVPKPGGMVSFRVVAGCYSVLQCVAVCCNALQCVAVRGSVLPCGTLR